MAISKVLEKIFSDLISLITFFKMTNRDFKGKNERERKKAQTLKNEAEYKDNLMMFLIFPINN